MMAALLVAAVLADTACWLFGVWTLSMQMEHWAQQAQAHGWTVTSGHQSWGGWPFAASVTLDAAAIGGGMRYLPGGLAWSAQRVVASVSITHPFTLSVAAEGQQFLRLAHAPDIGFLAGGASAELPLGSRNHGLGKLALTDVTAGIAGSGHPQDVRIGSVSLSWQADREAAPGRPLAAARLSVEARSIGLPDIERWPLGATVARAGVTVAVASPSLERTHADPDARGASQAAAWRDGGGTLVVRDATLRWGPLAMEGTAKLALDGRLQPSGSGTADVRGTAPALDAAARAGLIPPGLALTAKAVLAVMTHVQGPEGDAVRLPFLLRDSTISVGQIPVARLPDVKW